jgi:hypothetical protein
MRLWILFLVSSLLMATGCTQPIPLHPVSGRVTLEGKAVHKGNIMFVPDATKGNPHLQFGVGLLAPDGTYTAKTIQDEGVKPGWYKVMIIASENEPEPTLAWVPIWIVPEKYTKAETSGLSVEVVPEPAPGAYDFNLEP